MARVGTDAAQPWTVRLAVVNSLSEMAADGVGEARTVALLASDANEKVRAATRVCACKSPLGLSFPGKRQKLVRGGEELVGAKVPKASASSQ